MSVATRIINGERVGGERFRACDLPRLALIDDRGAAGEESEANAGAGIVIEAAVGVPVVAQPLGFRAGGGR